MNITQTSRRRIKRHRRPVVKAAVALLDEGSTVPFIARYRKEATGGLDDSPIAHPGRAPARYLRELADGKATVLQRH